MRDGVLVLAVGSALACAASPSPDAPSSKSTPGVVLAQPAVTAYTGPPRGLGVMGGIHPTRMTAALAAAGLDVKALPPLESLAPGPKQKVMRTFSEALGLPCIGCHAEDDFVADTRRKRVARRMWNELVRVVAMKGGAPVYCDSCHDGAVFHLDRRDPTTLAQYMCNTMIDSLERIDGRTHDCTTCHGDPPDLHLLETWKERPAPEIVRPGAARSPSSSGAAAIVPEWPIEGPRDPVDCGPTGERCPLAAWMRLIVAPAAARDRREDGELPRVLERVAAYAPEDEGFVALAKRAAAAARTGSAVELRAACGACHAEHKATWRATRRRRAPGAPASAR